MAVFLINICKFNGCGITFPSLGDLIQHIEDTHIDYDPKVVEQKEQAQPACLPLSYVLRFISEDARKESPFLSANTSGVELKRKLAIKHHSYSMSSSNRSNTPTGSEMDDDEMVVSESEDSNDSWTTEEFSSEFIMRYGSRHSGTGSNGTPGNEKPFACPVPGCKKRYKNVNGIKYHSKNGHKKDGKVRKGYKCHCGKSYKTAQGLKNHALVSHNSSPESVLSAQHVANITTTSNGTSVNASGIILQRSSSPSQSLGSLSPSSISNMSSSASSCHGSASGNTYNGNSNSAGNNNGGSNSTSSVVTTNVLQQLTNGTLGNGSPNVVATTNGVGLNIHHHQHHQSQQQQQHQFSSQQQPQLQSIGSSATASSEQMNTSNSACMSFNGQLLTTASSIANVNNTAVNSRISTAVIGAPPVATVAVSANVAPMNAAGSANSNTVTPIFGTSPIISPTFIEHKYSANTFKQRFLANLRANHGSASKTHFNNNNGGSSSNNNNKPGNKHSIGNNATSNSCDNTNGDNINTNAIRNDNTAAGSGLMVNHCSNVPAPGIAPVVGIDDFCSIQQQLSENYNKSAMYPRTIN
ncbi:putative uncharacterized protein DDB_G0285119 isoform X2 [Bactrocera tryoni]|uniref:putative uncharacterized protein DDB_G0285119 isoform X2 n=1 Tax=Bactrocera tryoni TaxID=59916 RepID=UPI001A95A617|nr:putative uncharacterized protein DDB_G0285119 isoform X2 [Bactrocera tryoni]